jgi:endoglycosylceramidase
LGVGGFLTEFGALSDSDKSAEEVTVIADLLNGYFRSWCYWQFKYYNDITTAARPGTTESFYDERGQLQENKVKALARPYAYAICGQPIKEEVGKGTYKLKWRASHKCYNKKTEIFTSPRFYFPYGARTSFSHNCEGCKLVGLARGEGYY